MVVYYDRMVYSVMFVIMVCVVLFMKRLVMLIIMLLVSIWNVLFSDEVSFVMLGCGFSDMIMVVGIISLR